MIEVCYCSPNRASACGYCKAREAVIMMLKDPRLEASEDDFDRIFLNYNISPKARLNILIEIDENEYTR